MKQIRKNLVTNILCLGTNVIVGILYTPYLVRVLGVVTYGVLPLAWTFNQYIIILTDSLQNSVTRFYSVAYRKGNYTQASQYFSSTIGVSLLLICCIIPLLCFLISPLENILNIPEELFQSVGYLIIYTVASLLASLISNCVNITIYSENRLDLLNYLKIIRNLAKFLINILLFVKVSTDVSNVGLASLIAEVIILFVSIVFYKKTKHKEIVFHENFISFAAMKPITKMLLWVMIIALSSVIIYKTDAILVNNYFGLYYTGVLGSMSEFCSYCICITGLIGVLYRPLMLIAYSEGRHEDLVRVASDGAYISGLLSSFLCGIVMGLSTPLLKIWLNDEISQYSLWLVIKLLIIPITTYGSTYSIVYNLWNRVRSSALWSIAISLLYVAVSVVLLEIGIGMTTFLIIGCISAIAQGTVLHIIIYKSIYPESMKLVYVKLVKCCLFFAAVFILSKIVAFCIQPSNIITLLLGAGISALFILCITPLFIRGRDIDALDVVVPVKSLFAKCNSLIQHIK